jgi:predicted DNA binding CopG/RHH family protein
MEESWFVPSLADTCIQRRSRFMKRKENKRHQGKFKNDKEVEDLLEGDMSDFIEKNDFTLTSFEFAPKNKTITIRVSEALLNAIQTQAKKRKTSYQKFIREALERVLKSTA